MYLFYFNDFNSKIQQKKGDDLRILNLSNLNYEFRKKTGVFYQINKMYCF
jgi:hypothetical protein